MDLASSISAVSEVEAPQAVGRRRWGPWATIGWAIPIMVVMVVFQTLGALVYLKLWKFLHPDQTISLATLGSNGAVLAFSLAVSAPAVLAIIALAVRLSRVPLREYLALKWPRARDIGIGFVSLAGVLLGTGILASLTGQQTPAFIADTFDTARAAGMLSLLVVTFVFVGPLQEELLFRGFLFRGFALSFGVWPTIVLTAAAWAIIHVQYQWFFVGEIFALGVLFGWLRARSGSLLLTFGLHAAVNAMAVVEAALMTAT
jgi:membrane protease YdiL (CAAX protease family)